MTELEDLFAAHAAAILAFALRRTDRATAEDVVSEVFVVAGRRIDRVPRDDARLWLYGVARRLLANQRRAERRRRAVLSALSDVARTRPHAEPHDPRLRDALDRLRPADREVLMLTAWEGLDAAEAARVLGCSPHAVHARLSRARTRLRAALDDDPAVAPMIPSTEARP